MWYDGYKTLTYNCLYNFIIGNRGSGKSYWAKRWAIKDYLKTKRKWAYVRRYETEFDELDTYFNDIGKEFPDVEFEVVGTDLYINGEQAGRAFPLSKATTFKSNPYPEYNKIIFDEFIIEQGTHHYLKSEVRKFLEFYETINRFRENPQDEVIAFFLSNAITMTNPYFLYFDLQLPYGKNIIAKNDMLLQLVQDVDFIDKKKNTRFGRLIEGTEYAKYSIENKFLLDNKEFVMKKTPRSKHRFSIKYDGVVYGVWVDFSEGKMFASEDHDPSCPFVYSLTLADHTTNTMLLKSLHTNPLFKNFVDNYKMGNVYFESIKVKNIIYEVIKMYVS